jgi:hypothetical protein
LFFAKTITWLTLVSTSLFGVAFVILYLWDDVYRSTYICGLKVKPDKQSVLV